LVSCQSKTDLKPQVKNELRIEAMDTLKSILAREKEWVKVHAAEHLLELDYRQEVDSIFSQEVQRSWEVPFYRIGIWRVLARSANPVARSQWTHKIHEVYLDELSVDRIHAAESLAKLEYAAEPIQTRDSILQLFASWAGAYESDESRIRIQSEFFSYLDSDQYSIREKKLAAYALREFGEFDQSDWSDLVDITLRESYDSGTRLYYTTLCWLKAPSDSLSCERMENLKEELLKTTSSQDFLAKRELAVVLGARGDDSQLSLLQTLVRLENGLNAGQTADIRAAAAYAILRIQRRYQPSLSWIDWGVIGIYGMLMLGIGLYYSRTNKTEEDFQLGGRKMNSVSIGISLFATLLSTVSYLSYPGEMIKHGPVIFAGMLGFPLVYFAAGWWLIPKIMEMKVTSAYEILELRLGASVRFLATFMFLSLRFLWMAAIVFVTIDIALLSVVAINSSYVPLLSSLLIVVTIVYTSMGGLKAVVATDVIQTFVFLGGALISILIVSYHFGSFSSWIPTEWSPNWKPFKLGFDPHERTTVGNAVMMLFAWYICTTGSDQLAIQRYLSTQDIQAARNSLKVSLYANLVAKCLLGLLGLAMLAFFTRNQHLLADGQTLDHQSDRLFPRFIVLGLPIGLSGLVIAGLLAAAMSSLSSGLNSVSTVISEDIINRFVGLQSKIRKGGALKQIQILSYVTGTIVMILSFFVANVPGTLFDVLIKVTHLFVAPLFVLFFMALFVRSATEFGTFMGGLLATSTAVGISFFGIFDITVFWILPCSFMTGVAGATILSFLGGKLNTR